MTEHFQPNRIENGPWGSIFLPKIKTKHDISNLALELTMQRGISRKLELTRDENSDAAHYVLDLLRASTSIDRNSDVRKPSEAPIEARGLEIYEGVDTQLLLDIVKGSTEPLMLEKVPRDSSERFATLDAAINWHEAQPGRLVYSLRTSDGQLAGAIWFTPPSEMTDEPNTHMFSIRVYETGREVKVAADFMKTAHELAQNQGISRTWLYVNAQNRAGRFLYAQFGYKQVPEHSTDDTIVMQYNSCSE